MTAERGRRRRQLLDNYKERIGYWKVKEEALGPQFGELALEETTDLS